MLLKSKSLKALLFALVISSTARGFAEGEGTDQEQPVDEITVEIKPEVGPVIDNSPNSPNVSQVQIIRSEVEKKIAEKSDPKERKRLTKIIDLIVLNVSRQVQPINFVPQRVHEHIDIELLQQSQDVFENKGRTGSAVKAIAIKVSCVAAVCLTASWNTGAGMVVMLAYGDAGGFLRSLALPLYFIAESNLAAKQFGKLPAPLARYVGEHFTKMWKIYKKIPAHQTEAIINYAQHLLLFENILFQARSAIKDDEDYAHAIRLISSHIAHVMLTLYPNLLDPEIKADVTDRLAKVAQSTFSDSIEFSHGKIGQTPLGATEAEARANFARSVLAVMYGIHKVDRTAEIYVNQLVEAMVQPLAPDQDVVKLCERVLNDKPGT